MRNRNKNSSVGFLSFISGFFGVIVGGLLVFFLMGGSKSNEDTINNSKEDKYIEDDNKVSNNTTNYNNLNKVDKTYNKDQSMESVVVKKAIDSMVGINTISEVNNQGYFGNQSGYVEGIGSGSIVTKDGYILTNSHVVSDGDVKQINVLFSDGSTEEAELIWNDSSLDLAILKVDKKDLKPIELGDSDQMEVGDRTVAIGNPLGFELQSTVTSGIISGLNRSVSFNTGVSMDGLMQTDAAINSGNSGGALLNSNGDLIGINTAKAGNSDGIGFAIPINIVKPVIKKVIETGEFNSVYIGITGQSIDYLKQIPNFNPDKLGVDEGVYVVSVFNKDSKIEKGDVITEVDGKKVTDMSSLRKLLLSYSVGDKAKLTIYREGKKIEEEVTFNIDTSNLDEFKDAKPSLNKDRNNQDDRLNPFFDLP